MSTFEKFRPRLKPGQFFATPMAVVFELDDGSKQVTLPAESQAFTKLIDGHRSVQEIIETLYREQHRVPFKALISALQKLREADCLDNANDSLDGSEFKTRADIFSKTETWWERPLWSKTLISRWVAMRPSQSLFMAFSIGSLSLTLLFLGLFAFGPTSGIFSGVYQSMWTSEFLKINKSYAFGLLFFICSASALITAKTAFKAMMALLLTGRISQVKIELNFYSLALRMHDDRLYFSSHRWLAALSAATISLTQFFFFAVISALAPHWTHLSDLLIVSVILALVDLNPYRKSELTSFFSIIINQTSVSHLLPYLKSRSLTAVIGQGERMSNESAYAIYSALAFMWTISAFNLAIAILSHNYGNLLATIFDGTLLESVSAAVIFNGVAIVSIYLVFDLARTIANNLVFPLLTQRLSAEAKRKTRAHGPNSATSYANMISRLPLFNHTSRKAIDVLLAHSEARTYDDGAHIVIQGTASHELFALIQGEAKVIKRYPSGGESTVARLRAPVLFGENTLLDSARRSADVVALGDCEVIAIPASALAELEVHGDDIDHRAIIDRLRAGQAISASELFADAPSEAVSLFLDEGEIIKAQAGTTLIEQGRLDKDFYLVVRGAVEVTVDEMPIRILTQGDFFGEMALLFDSPRSATVTTTEDVTLLKLTSEKFWTVVSRHLSLALFLETVSELRLREDLEAIQSSVSSKEARHA